MTEEPPVTRHRGWFRVTPAPGGGVVLEVRIPGCRHEDRPYPDRGDAIIAAGQIYDEYCQAVKDLAG
jgi:hypothetical protein